MQSRVITVEGMEIDSNGGRQAMKNFLNVVLALKEDNCSAKAQTGSSWCVM